MVFRFFGVYDIEKIQCLLDFTKFAAMAVVCGNVLMIFSVWKNYEVTTEALKKSIFKYLTIIR